MELFLKIGPYEVVRRTKYSKPRLLDKDTKKDITKENEKILEKIISDYKKQEDEFERYFKIKDGKLIGVTTNLFMDNINFLFIPNSVEEIGTNAVIDEMIYYVNFPSSLKIIGAGSFSGCTNLKYVDIPDNVKSVKNEAFFRCSSLEYVKLPKKLTSIDSDLFSGCAELKTVIMGNLIESINAYAFSDCAKLENITLSNSLKTIGYNAFNSCLALEKIDIPASVKKIGVEAFTFCRSLKEIILPEGIDEVNMKAFATCEKLENVKLPDTIESIYSGAFANCKNLKNINIPNNVVKIGHFAFNETKQLENIDIPKNLCGIESCPFEKSGAKSLTFNYDLNFFEHFVYKFDLISGSEIDKLIINKDVKTISPSAFDRDGGQIKTIDYKGTEEEFKEFKKNNEELFRTLPNIEKINFINNKEKENVNVSKSER